MTMEELLQTLVAIPSPCGFEHRVIRCLYDFMKDKVDELHLSHSGVPSSVISIPSRYAHSPNEEMDLRDYANCRKLLDGFILSMGDRNEFNFI